MKNTILFSLMIIIYSCNSPKVEFSDELTRKPKTVKAYYYNYKNGIMEKKPFDSLIYKDNEFGFSTDAISNEGTTHYEYIKDTLLSSVVERKKEGDIISYKKIIKYNANNRKESIRIYKCYNNLNTPELAAGMRFYYNSNNKISSKSFFGDIQYNEDEFDSTIDPDESIFDREFKRRMDSTVANYIRNDKGKIQMIYFNNDTAHKIVFTYNQKGKILSKRTFMSKKQKDNFKKIFNDDIMNSFDGTKYYYDNDTVLIKKERIDYGFVNDITIYNKKENNIIEIHMGLDREVSYKWKNEIYENGNFKKKTKYDKIEEPVLTIIYEYEYY